MARFLRRIRLRWILAGGAFIGAVVSTGCSSHPQKQDVRTNEELGWHTASDRDLSTETAGALTPDRDFSAKRDLEAKPQRVNVCAGRDAVAARKCRLSPGGGHV